MRSYSNSAFAALAAMAAGLAAGVPGPIRPTPDLRMYQSNRGRKRFFGHGAPRLGAVGEVSAFHPLYLLARRQEDLAHMQRSSSGLDNGLDLLGDRVYQEVSAEELRLTNIVRRQYPVLWFRHKQLIEAGELTTRNIVTEQHVVKGSRGFQGLHNLPTLHHGGSSDTRSIQG